MEAWNSPPRVDVADVLRIESGIIGSTFTVVLSFTGTGTGKVLGRYEAKTDAEVDAILDTIAEMLESTAEAPAAPEAAPPRSPYGNPDTSVQERAEWVKSSGHLGWVWNEPERQWYEVGTLGGKGVEAYAAPASNVVDITTGIRSYRLSNGSEPACDWLRGVWGYLGTLPSQKPATAPTLPAAEPSLDMELVSRIGEMLVARGLPVGRSAKAIATAIQTGIYSDILDTSNKNSRAIFTKLTGVKLPTTIKGTKELFVGKPFPVLSEGGKPSPTPEPAATPKAPAATEDDYEDLPPMSLTAPDLQPLNAPSIASLLLSGVDVEAEIASIPDPPEKTEAQAPVGAILMPPATAAQSADPAVAGAARKWSPYQSAIFNEVRTGSGHVVIEAVAGSGKTTTILEAVKQINTDKKVLMVAFNKTIQKELQARLPKDRTNIAVSTLAAHGYSILRRYWKARYISTKGRGEKLLSNARDEEVFAFAVREYIGNDANADQVRADVKDLMGLCESFLAMDDEAIRGVQEDYELLLGSDGTAASWYFDGWHNKARRRFTHADVLRWVKAGLQHRLEEPPANSNYAKRMVSDRDTGLYNEMTEDGKLGFVSFRDMSFVVSATKSMVPETLFDVIFVDETQDMDVAQIELVFRSLAPQGRIVVVGDRNQSIYRFRGADSEAIPRLIKELSATVLPLSVSYRVPGCVAEEARKLVPSFSVPETTPDGKPWPVGSCRTLKAKEMVGSWAVGDIVITRINKPLVPMGMLALGSGISPWILGEGNAIANQIKYIMYKIRRKSIADNSVQAFINGAEQWLKEEQAEVRREVLSRIARWEAREKKEGRRGVWRGDKEETVREDSEFIERQLIFDAFWNESKTGLAQNPSVKTADDIEAILKNIAPSEKAVEAMTPEEYKQMLSERLVLTSVHRIKGGEANRVFLLEDTFKYGRNGWQKRIPPNEKDQKEETNLWYVAVTRAKNEPDKPGQLLYVQGVDQLLGRGWDKGSG